MVLNNSILYLKKKISAVIVPSNLAVSWSVDWQHIRFDPDKLSFTSVHVIVKKGQENVHCGYKRNV